MSNLYQAFYQAQESPRISSLKSVFLPLPDPKSYKTSISLQSEENFSFKMPKVKASKVQNQQG
jgi:hypothetical protein